MDGYHVDAGDGDLEGFFHGLFYLCLIGSGRHLEGILSLALQHGVFLGTRTGSETTAAAAHQLGVLRRDPMAMLPFCGYNMGDYFAHWLNVGKKLKNPPKIFSVNWFRTDETSKFMWPGFGDNIRVIKWIIDRVQGKVVAKETALGLLPDLKDLDLSGLNIPRETVDKLFSIDPPEWTGELQDIEKYLSQFGSRTPEAIWEEYRSLAEKLGQSVSK